MQNSAATLENSLAISYKVKYTLIPVLRYLLPREINLCSHKNVYNLPWINETLMLIAVVFMITKYCKGPKCPLGQENRQTNHTVEYSSVIKKEWTIVNLTTWMKLKSNMLSERRQSQRFTYHMIPCIRYSPNDIMEMEKTSVVAMGYGWKDTHKELFVVME